MSKSNAEVEKQREINREHAKNSRLRKKRKLDELNDTVENLENKINKLEEENHKLKLFKTYVEEHFQLELFLLSDIVKLDLPESN